MRYYIVFAFLFIVGFGVFVYSIDSHSYALGLGGYSLNLPIALWLMGVLGVFAFFSWIFLFKHHISNKIRLHHEKRDFDKLLNQILAQDTQKTFLKTKFKNMHAQNLSQILARYDLQADLNTPSSGCEKVDNLFLHYQNIENNTLEAKEHAKHSLTYEHAYFSKRFKAFIHNDLKNAFEALKNAQIPLELRRYAFIEITQKAQEKEILKALNILQGFLDKECVMHFLKAFFEKSLNLDTLKISQLCKEAHYTKNDYLQLAQKSQGFLIPDKWFKFFEILSQEDEEAQKAFLFVLLELEMNDLAKERLAALPFEEYTLLNAYMDLKKERKAYKLEAFL
ncbi:hypothetical protein [Helicobacter cetorum]|uniref:Periplasmic protein n=1 Tax=Helicobacter cetorum (strain ATCC BAA-540 / CCUG 52418 / MIT 99-5656) TaxID=1163745 RepID=I0ER59_HELCM|nr:hypothetical protein [Helicobacter cetorum]AFI05428.1 hypothetical protein HCD_02020 [Helicobacter cetorum MIT 99-5656]